MLLLSIHPRFAEAILAGTKKVELRRRVPRIAAGAEVLIYSTLPMGAIVGKFAVEQVITPSVGQLWRQTCGMSGVTRTEFDTYFDGVATGVGILVAKATRFQTPISLKTLREVWPGFHPPQGFRYLTPLEVLVIEHRLKTRLATIPQQRAA